jgi:hypothetical protein
VAGFCNSAYGLQTPDFGKYEANSRKVSSRNREYSRFRETEAGDRVRIPLRGAGRSRFGVFSAPQVGSTFHLLRKGASTSSHMLPLASVMSAREQVGQNRLAVLLDSDRPGLDKAKKLIEMLATIETDAAAEVLSSRCPASCSRSTKTCHSELI